MSNKCRPYDAIEHELVQQAASDALTLASMPGMVAATKLVKSGNATISVRVFIADERANFLLDNKPMLDKPRPRVVNPDCDVY